MPLRLKIYPETLPQLLLLCALQTHLPGWCPQALYPSSLDTRGWGELSGAGRTAGMLGVRRASPSRLEYPSERCPGRCSLYRSICRDAGARNSGTSAPPSGGSPPNF